MGNAFTVRDAACAYHRQGYVPVPIESGTKKCTVSGWDQTRLDSFNLDKLFPEGCTKGIGILNGEPSGGHIDIDLDCAEARAAAELLLPATERIWGRQSASNSHYGYRVDASAERCRDQLQWSFG